MKAEKILTSNKGLLLYYSASGNTKAIVNCFDKEKFDIISVRKGDEITDFSSYSTIVIGTSTWQRGMPPRGFIRMREALGKWENKKIALFGSGRSEYDYFCGALDLLEQVLEPKNEILFKVKYEGYPKDIVFEEMKKKIKQLEEECL